MSKPAPLAARRILVALAALVSIASFALPARADENLFGFLYTADTLPKGKGEIYGWATMRNEKISGTYRGLDLSAEGEYGFSDRFQGSLYLNFRGHKIENVPDFEDRDGGIGFQGTQVALKYRLMSPYDQPIGLALYFEPGYAHIDKVTGERVQEWEYEFKVIAQKNFAEDRLVLAANYMIEQEFERASEDGPDFEGELLMELTGGLSYRFARGWSAGVETRGHTEFPDMDLGNQEHMAWFLGPNVHYGARKWWFTVAHIRQVDGWPNTGDSSLHLEEHEKMETRLKVGVNL
jgi:hypothetical protein